MLELRHRQLVGAVRRLELVRENAESERADSGGVRGDVDRREVSRRGRGPQSVANFGWVDTAWSGFRIRGALATLVLCVALGLWWGWIGGFVLAALAAITIADADSRCRSGLGSLTKSVFLDMTLIGVAIVFADLEPAGVGAAYVYMMAVPLLLLPATRAVWVMAYGTVWTVLALSPHRPRPCCVPSVGAFDEW